MIDVMLNVTVETETCLPCPKNAFVLWIVSNDFVTPSAYKRASLSRRLKNMASMPPTAASAGVTLEWPNVSSCQCSRTTYPKVLASHLHQGNRKRPAHSQVLHQCHFLHSWLLAHVRFYLWPSVIWSMMSSYWQMASSLLTQPPFAKSSCPVLTSCCTRSCVSASCMSYLMQER